MKKELITFKDPKSPVAETFRTLRTNIQFMNTNKKLKTLLVTSTFPGEGKSWTASNLAVTFAQAGQRVILIDADMRKGRLYSIFGVLPRPGLSNYLSGIDENSDDTNNIMNYLRETEVPNLYLMPAGNIPPNPSELLITGRMINLLEELKNQSDLVIIDGTPSKLVTDAVILSRIVDSTIVVAAHNETKKDDLQKVIKDLKNVGANIAGIVYNKKPISTKRYNENYYYSSIPQKTPAKTKDIEHKTIIEEKQNNEDLYIAENKVNEEFSKIPESNVEEPEKFDEIIHEVNESEFQEQPQPENNIEQPVLEEFELPKAMQHKDENVENEKAEETSSKTPQERTAEILKEFSEYLKKEKKERGINN